MRKRRSNARRRFGWPSGEPGRRLLKLGFFVALVAIAYVVADHVVKYVRQGDPVFVEVEARVHKVRFQLRPSDDPLEIWQRLLDEEVRVTEANWRGARVLPTPSLVESVEVSRLDLRSAQPFDAPLEVRMPITLEVTWLGPHSVAIGIGPDIDDDSGDQPGGDMAEALDTDPRLRAQVRWAPGLEMKTEQFRLPKGWEELQVGESWAAVPDDRAGFLVGDASADSSVRLELASSQATASRKIWEYRSPGDGQDPGEVMERALTVPQSAEPLAVDGGVVFVANPSEPREPLLSALEIEKISLAEQYLDHSRSFVAEGKVRFPDANTREVEFGPRYLLKLVPQSSFHLRAVTVGSEGLHLLLSGTARRVRGGYDALSQLGPSRVEAWYANEELKWVISAWLTVVAAFVSAGKGLDYFKGR